MDDHRLSALRDLASASRTPVPIAPDELRFLLDSHVAALALADAAEVLQSVDISGAPARQGEYATASEIRNRVRRQIEERRLRASAALAAFRAASGTK
jgi:hypothetical protein